MKDWNEAHTKIAELEQRLRDRGVVDVKFFKTAEYFEMSSLEQLQEICDVIEAVLDGKTRPASPVGDSVQE